MRRAGTWLLGGLLGLIALATLALRDEAPSGVLTAIAPGTSEVLERDAEGEPLLARVALVHALPRWAEARLALGGTWSYLLRDRDGLVVFDVGPRYPLAWCLVSWSAPKMFARRLDNNGYLFTAIERLFPGLPVREVVLSHWHADHTEGAPEFQRLAFERWGTRPPLRIRGVDRAARANEASGPGKLVPAGAEAVFRGAGYRDGDWQWGADLADGEAIGHTGFRVMAMPGHTLGTIALVNPERRISLGPSLVRAEGWTEAPSRYALSYGRWQSETLGYRVYSTHPGRPGRDEVSPQAEGIFDASR